MSSSACGGGTAARNGLRSGPGIETAAGASRQGWVSACPILESGTDGAAGVGGVGSNAVDDAAEGTAEVAAAGAAVGTTVKDEAEDGVEPGPAIAVGSAWAVLGGAGWPTDEPGVEDRPA